MLSLIVSPDANQDLDGIWDYIAENSPDAAEQAVVEITEKFKLFQQMPEAGRARPELQAGLRSFPVGRYVIFYHLLLNT